MLVSEVWQKVFTVSWDGQMQDWARYLGSSFSLFLLLVFFSGSFHMSYEPWCQVLKNIWELWPSFLTLFSSLTSLNIKQNSCSRHNCNHRYVCTVPPPEYFLLQTVDEHWSNFRFLRWSLHSPTLINLKKKSVMWWHHAYDSDKEHRLKF